MTLKQTFVPVCTLFADLAVKYFCLAEALYYKTLEGIINQERKRLGDTDLSVCQYSFERFLDVSEYYIRTVLNLSQSILEQDTFHRSLTACCLEIVMFSYHPPGEFRRVLQIFDIPPYHFYKVC